VSPRPENERALVVQKCLDLLDPLDEGERVRVLRTVATYFDIVLAPHHGGGATAVPPPVGQRPAQSREPVFSGHEPISAKDFLRQKEPRTDVERAMCLAYYLAHYRDVPSFKTGDIAKLNTEAAQRKFANTAYTVNNAATTGYFVAAPGGNRQLSSMGEQYVEALPDRQAARSLRMNKTRRRRSTNRKRSE
jgi:hypothetical protein